MNLLIKFTFSDDSKFKQSAYLAIQDYLMSSSKTELKHLERIIKILVVGCIEEDLAIQTVCAKSLNFLVTNGLVYKPLDEEKQFSKQQMKKEIQRIKGESPENVLDAIMILSGSENDYIKATAFSTLNTLATESSHSKTVMAKIKRDSQISATAYGTNQQLDSPEAKS